MSEQTERITHGKETLPNIGQFSKEDLKELNRMARKGEISKFRGSWVYLRGHSGLGPEKTIYGPKGTTLEDWKNSENANITEDPQKEQIVSNMEWDEANAQYDREHGNISGAQWADERDQFNEEKLWDGMSEAELTCRNMGGIWVKTHVRSQFFNSTKVKVGGYCRMKGKK